LVSWQGAATLYFLMLFLILIIQNFGRMVPVYN
jgi:hypothetical protein